MCLCELKIAYDVAKIRNQAASPQSNYRPNDFFENDARISRAQTSIEPARPALSYFHDVVVKTLKSVVVVAK